VKAARLRRASPKFSATQRDRQRAIIHHHAPSDSTGGIASGKSAVAAMLREWASPSSTPTPWPIGPSSRAAAYDEVLQEFGPGVVAPDGRVDRPKLSAIVFADRARLDRLNAIVHSSRRRSRLPSNSRNGSGGTRDAAFVEAALLIESGIHKNLDGLVWLGARLNSNSSASSRGGPQRSEPAAALPPSFPSRKNCVWPRENRLFRLSRETRRQVEALATKLRRSQMAR